MALASGYRKHYSDHIRLALPVMFSQMGHMIVQITDSMMLGHYDTTALAASTFGNSVVVIGLVFGVGFTFAMTPLVGAARGAGDIARIGRWAKNGAVANLAMGVAVAAVMLSIYPFLDRMGQTPDVLAQAKPFYLFMAISVIPVAVFQSFKQFAEGVGNTRLAFFITFQEVLLNVGLNYVLIFGKLGFPALGVVGSGTATLIARISMPVAFAILFFRLDFFRVYRAAFRTARVEMAALREYAALGVPLGGQFFLEVAAFAGGAIMMGWIGEIEQAAHQIAIGVAAFTFMGATGIASAATIRVSNFFGAGERAEMRRAGFAAAHIVLAYMSFTALCLIVLRGALPTFYTKDPAVIATAAGLLILAAVFQLFDGLQVVMLGCLRALTDTRIPTAAAFISYIVIALPLSYVCAFPLGLRETGIWVGYVIGLLFAAVLFFLRFTVLSRVRS
jgi:MATE family multidrug resistance protein